MPAPRLERRLIVLIAQGLTGGGAEMSMLRLAEDFAGRDFDVHVAVLRRSGQLVSMIPKGLRVDEIGGGRLGCILRLARYLHQRRPDAIFGFMTYASVVAILAQAFSPSLKRVIASEHTVFSHSIRIRGGLPKLFHYAAPVAYRWARAIICVSHGVETDLARTARLPRRMLRTIYNPVITADLLERSFDIPEHPWLSRKDKPVILAAGRLEKLKNYPLMLRAFARLRSRADCRLLILGEGSQREALGAEIRQLGLSDCVELAGFRANPMSYMRRADAFVLSSDFEGLSNVLIEAMAVGCPVVSTDAPHGPREVLQDGRHGRLVPVGDVNAMAAAMHNALCAPGDRRAAMDWALSFQVRRCADAYLRVAQLQ
jgi:glycosyltransferase involved in cell wall biosynthesis